MKQKLANLEEVIKALRGFLPQYLAEHDIDVSRNFLCLNPKHEDATPSMSCKQNPENAYCFSCSACADIFQAAHWIEGKPISGPGFIEDNVRYLAEKYGVDIQLEELTEEEQYRFRTYKAYADAARLVADTNFGNYRAVNKELKKRGWKKNFIRDLQAGTVNYKEFREAMKNLGYEAKFLDEIDLGRPNIFNNSNLTFTICDEWGRPVGFAARNLNYAGDPNDYKYMNQNCTGLRCNIYQKGMRLYQIHTAKKYTPPLYIFEGYADVITAQQAGLHNCVAIGGTAFTDEHIALLKRLNMYDVVLVLDSDKSGQDKTARLLDEKFSGHRDLKISIINLPDSMDPDDFIRANSLDDFLKLKKWSAFEWRLNRYPEDADAEEVCRTMIPLIVNEPSYLTQDSMCSTLARFTGIEKHTIQQELERLQSQREREKQRERQSIIDRSMIEIRKSPADAKSILREAANLIEQAEERHTENALSLQSSIQFAVNQRAAEESSDNDSAGFHLSPLGLRVLGERLNGNWKEDVFLCYGGAANSGKTSLLSQLAYEIASNPENNACVIFHTIDDSAPQILPRFVVQGYGLPDLTLNEVRNPNHFAADDPDVLEKRAIGYDNILNLMRDGRIVLKDANDGTSFGFGEALIAYYQKHFPDRKIVYILDNLHKTPDYSNFPIRERYTKLSGHMKQVATKRHVCVIASVEYTKLPRGTIPHNNNIAETRAIIYDSSFIAHLYNDLHERGEQAYCIHKHQSKQEHQVIAMPRIRLGIGKNKITEFKGRVFLDMYPASGIFRYVSTDIAEADMRLRMKTVKQGKPTGYNGPTRDWDNQAILADEESLEPSK